VLQPRARAATVARACREISDWAERARRPGTALEFMQAAALALPGDAELAHEVGRLARATAEYPRAETWYRQAIFRARRARDWLVFSRSYLTLGIVLRARGSFALARKSFVRALRAAERHSLQPLVASAHHELTVLAIKADRPHEVPRYARAALQAYGAGHPRLPALAHDFAVYLMKTGHFDAALRAFRSCPPDFGTPSDRLARAAAIVRAAGILGEKEAYESGWREAESLLTRPGTAEGATAALLAMARGAASAGERQRAETAARRAGDLATARGEFAAQADALAVLESIRRSDPGSVPDEIRPASPPVMGVVEEFERAFR
jgi:tetratricopeptide (TPR) repeat protein